ncbi:hypothetical protein EJ05DRAFT_305360 [Pseudovirgaria hyperparasitica]|uniref:Mitochondrial export translocase Oxa2 n=1 Tax=Pseudovirgaria hyperparasitica TaxID=470096 RepID=A0A6A6WAQ3_9PEZI|nr:uncharacterized protein EJ05DRAFT_305360 [Pseudovirgaria hyperparasitica]KAF2759645.1 hypothetical protein EJ05DRAFT_305360 [Pseudovirgaria hyperparasitica]
MRSWRVVTVNFQQVFSPALCIRHHLPRTAKHTSTAALPSRLIQRRTFHVSRPRQMPEISAAAEMIIVPSHYLLTTLHGFGLPWFAAIPAGALLVRCLFLLISEIPAAKRAQRLHNYILPVGYARQPVVAEETRRQWSRVTRNRALIKKEVELAVRKDGELVRKRFGADSWYHELARFVALQTGQLAVFLSMAETVRRLSGAKIGLLGMLANWRSGWKPDAVDGAVEAVGTTDASQIAASPAIDVYFPLQTLDDCISVPAKPSIASTITTSAQPHEWFDPSMATEGFLWFTNLCTADPSAVVLPGLVCLSMLANIRMSSGLQSIRDTSGPTLGTRILSLLSIAIFPFIKDFPAAVLYYWFCSQFFLGTSRLLVRWWIPKSNPVKSRKPPVDPPSFKG